MSIRTSGYDHANGHACRVIEGEVIPGTWRAVCTCGWAGKTFGAKGAISAARGEKWSHLFDAEDGIIAPLAS